MRILMVKTIFQGVTKCFAVKDQSVQDLSPQEIAEKTALEFADWYKDRSADNPTRYPGRTTATDIYETFCTWCEERDLEPSALPTFARTVSTVFEKLKQNGRVYYVVPTAKVTSLRSTLV